MTKSQSRRKNVLKTVTKTTEKALPILDKGLTTVGKTVKNVAEVSIPVVEKGVSTVYGTMSTGFEYWMKLYLRCHIPSKARAVGRLTHIIEPFQRTTLILNVHWQHGRMRPSHMQRKLL